MTSAANPGVPQQEKPVVQSVWHEPPKGKKVELVLMYGEFTHAFKVLSITNTTWYLPKMWLSKEIVDKLNERDNWQVTIVEDHILQNIAATIAGKLPVPV